MISLSRSAESISADENVVEQTASDDGSRRKDVARRIPAQAAVQVLAQSGTLLDVRTGAEFDTLHVPGSLLVPLDRLAAHRELIREQSGPLLLLCRTGQRAELARRRLGKAGIADLQVIEGGIEAWTQAGGPLERGEARMSIERQVRTAAGMLAFITSTLALFVHPGFAMVPALIGVGLFVAGVWDWCGLGLWMARAPWNRSAAEGGCPVSR